MDLALGDRRLDRLRGQVRRSPASPYSLCSVKWVGLFVTALVGIYTIEDLWDKFGDLSLPYVRRSEGAS